MPWLVLYGEFEAEESAHPLVLRDGGQPLIQQVLEAVVVGLDHKAAPLEVGPLVADDLDEADQLTLVGGENMMPGGHGPAEEGYRVAVLDQHRPEAVGRSVTLNDERLGEVWHGEYWGRGDCLF